MFGGVQLQITAVLLYVQIDEGTDARFFVLVVAGEDGVQRVYHDEVFDGDGNFGPESVGGNGAGFVNFCGNAVIRSLEVLFVQFQVSILWVVADAGFLCFFNE